MASNDIIPPEDLAECTQALIEVLDPEANDDDLQFYARIEQRIKKSEQQRFRDLEETQRQLKVLSQTLTQLRTTSTREAANWKSSKDHQDDIEELQVANFDLARKINEKEKKLQTTKNEAEELSKALDNLDQVDVESQEEMDKDAIAVVLFRQMGFVPSYGKDDTKEEASVFDSIMVTSETKNRSIMLEVNDEMMKAKSITPYILANHLWLASE
ncbi:hypothetical protein CBS101457_002702 [Exobasidium rhododendri]|nr:hypothetical protein CBS101457_002702 [Exobasidium rhododendri]